MEEALPILPHSVWQDLPHDGPVLQSTLVLPPIKLTSFLDPEDALSTRNSGENSRVNLMLGHEVCLTELAVQEVGRDRIPETKRGSRVLLTENDHVCEISVTFFAFILTEKPARGEDCLDGADGEGSRIKGEVARIVLSRVSLIMGGRLGMTLPLR